MSTDPNDQVQTMKRNLEASTGVAWSEWLQRAQTAGSDKHGAMVKYLKTEYGTGHGYANLVAHSVKEQAAGGPPPEADLVSAQYQGKKAGLRPIYDAVVRAINAFGPDLELAPKKTYVSLRRKKQFGLVQPSTATRVDVGLNLKGKPASGRLEASGSFNAMVSHRVRVTAVEEVDAELIGWLREAFDAAG